MAEWLLWIAVGLVWLLMGFVTVQTIHIGKLTREIDEIATEITERSAGLLGPPIGDRCPYCGHEYAEPAE